ncbi:ABC transporter permease [Oryzibacter oryziterrae]|uniref:ABC transporter permease n=1 Tax=Oryzibacter oryziterrae TaxID=2766474 RepID=UPI001F02307E|nr:ABC transporter permease subunit [Oryzibacter oryziterrae]
MASDLAPPPKTSKNPLGLLMIAAPVVLMGLFLLYPALRVVLRTFGAADGSPGFSLENYARFFNDSYSLNNLGITLWTTVVTLILLIVVNLPIALYLRFRKGRLATFIQALALFPMFVPGVIICYALIRYIGPNGLLQSLLEHVGITGYQTPIMTPWGPVIGLLWDAMPFTLLVLTAGLAGISNAAIEAAQDVGASRLRILWSIVLPQIRGSLVVCTSLNFLSLFGSVLQPYMLGPTSPELMGPFMLRTFSSVRDPLQAGTQATITFLICSVAGLLYILSMGNRRKAEKETVA